MDNVIFSEILDGLWDTELKALETVIKERKESLNNRKIYSIRTGDTVKFNSSVRPKYLSGLKATVTKTNQKTVTVRINDDDKFSARRFGYAPFRTPVSLVDKVENV